MHAASVQVLSEHVAVPSAKAHVEHRQRPSFRPADRLRAATSRRPACKAVRRCGLAQKRLDLHRVQRGPAAGTDVVAVGEAGEMPGLAAGHRATDPFAEGLLEGHLKTGEISIPAKLPKAAGRTTACPCANRGARPRLRWQGAKHRGDHLGSDDSPVRVVVVPLQPVLRDRAGQIAGEPAIFARTVCDRPLTGGDHQFGDIEVDVAFDRAALFHPVKFAKAKMRQRAGRANAEPGAGKFPV